jgi:hypothetical protein
VSSLKASLYATEVISDFCGSGKQLPQVFLKVRIEQRLAVF